jgi:hypothetical protein
MTESPIMTGGGITGGAVVGRGVDGVDGVVAEPSVVLVVDVGSSKGPSSMTTASSDGEAAIS